MKKKELFVNEKKMYALVRDDAGTYFMEVVVGGFAMEYVAIRLLEAEKERYHEEGVAFLDDLAYEICKNTSRFKDRLQYM